MRRIVKKVNGKLLAGVLVGAVFALIGSIAVAYSHSQARIDRNAKTAREAQATAHRALLAVKALCAQREDLDSRIKSEARGLARSKAYLRQHPHGAPGIPRALIVQSIADDTDTLANSMKTRRNLSILDC